MVIMGLRRYLVLFGACMLLVVGNTASAQSQLRETMGAERFEAAGLQKLSPAELAKLEEWIEGRKKFAAAHATYAAHIECKKAAREPELNLVQTRIDGEFKGWDGETVFVLQNGQVWRQATYSYHYHYAYSPKVTIVRGDEGWVMQVEGVERSLKVVRVR
jgi:hypothetical protein